MMLTDGVTGSPKYNDLNTSHAADFTNVSQPYSFPAYPDAGDEFGLGFDLRHQSSFDSAAASITPPSSNVNQLVDFNAKDSHIISFNEILERKSSIDPIMSSQPSFEEGAVMVPDNSIIAEVDLPGAGLRRLASLNEYRPSSAGYLLICIGMNSFDMI